MLWFITKEKKKKMEFIQSYIPTSKAQLLQVSMWFCKGDTAKAQEMVDFYVKNMPNLPDFDPIAPTFMQQVKTNASGLFSWIKENQSDILQGYQFIQSVIKNKGALPDIATEMVEEPLQDINE